MGLTDEELSRLRAELEEKLAGRRCVVVGVGNELRGDDAAGRRLAERLEGKTRAVVFVGGDVPEDYAVRVADERPEVVLLLDAAAMDLPPGACRLLAAEEIPPVPGVTHRPSLEMFAAFVRLDCGADTYLLAIQPNMARLGVGDSMSPEVEDSLDALKPLLIEVLSPCPEHTSADERERGRG